MQFFRGTQTKRRVDLLILESNETIPVSGSDPDDLGIVDEGGVAIDKGKIVAAASSRLLERKYSASRIISAKGEIILPGFVDPHTHLVFAGSREEEFRSRQTGSSYLDIMKKGGGIMQTVRATRETSEDQLLSDSRARLCAGVAAGTTTFEIKSGYGLQPYDELKILRVIRRLQNETACHLVPTFLGAHAIPPYWNQDDYSRVVIQEMIPAVAKGKLARFCDVFCEDGAFDVRASNGILHAGLRRGLEAKIHADQFTDNGGAKLANDIGAVSADHLVHSDRSELERMTKTGVVPVVLPVSSQSLLGQDFANARKMLDVGLPLALGTDFSPSNWALGLLTVAAVAARQLRMSFEEIIRGITINAARALGLNHRAGSLTPGKAADIVVLRAPSHKRIGYSFGEGMVDKVLIAGNQIVADGRMIND